MSTSKLLRTKTADLHQAAEQALDVAGIREGSLSLRSYTGMILAHYQVWNAVSSWLPTTASARDRNFIARMLKALKADLKVLGVAAPPEIDFSNPTKGPASLFGAVYVLRGSTLGGTMIDRKLRDCPELSQLAGFNFHGACSNLGPRHWPEFLKEMEAEVVDTGAQEEALAAARAVFGLYLG